MGKKKAAAKKVRSPKRESQSNFCILDHNHIDLDSPSPILVWWLPSRGACRGQDFCTAHSRLSAGSLPADTPDGTGALGALPLLPGNALPGGLALALRNSTNLHQPRKQPTAESTAVRSWEDKLCINSDSNLQGPIRASWHGTTAAGNIGPRQHGSGAQAAMKCI